MLSFNMSLVYNIINLVILCLLLKKFLIKPVTEIMEKREAMISQRISNACISEKEAKELKNRYEVSLRNARDESGRIVEAAKKQAKEESDRILRETELQATEMFRKAEKDIETQREKTMAGIRSQIAGVAFAAARKVSEGYGRAEDNLALYDQFIEQNNQ